VTEQLPSWPTTPPTYGSVVLREFTDEDAHPAVELGDDPYIPLIGSLPALPTAEQALEWIHRQRGRLAEGIGLSFAIADAESDNAVGAIGLWLQNLPAGRASAGYSVSHVHRGRGIASSALKALTTFAWTIPALYRPIAIIRGTSPLPSSSSSETGPRSPAWVANTGRSRSPSSRPSPGAYALDGYGIRPSCVSSETWS
jgi:ribosomal-protein-alanine N-acetyltransferase